MTALNSQTGQVLNFLASTPQKRALLLVGFGLAGAPPPAALPPLHEVAQRLAALTALPVQPLSPIGDPDAALSALAACAAAAGSAPTLAPLAIDPGTALPAGGSWVEALGAWRQPCLLVVAAGQLSCGWPAAGTALLRQSGVPLLGLLQWAGDWDGAARRRDGLPWLGRVGEAESGNADIETEAEAQVVLALARRWQELSLN